MPMRTTLLLALVSIPHLAGPVHEPLRARQDALRDAVALGRTHDDGMLEAFNKGYLLSPSGSVERAEIVTEFRRAVLIVREHALRGDDAYGLVDLAKTLEPYRGQVTFSVWVRLQPLNTLVKEPAYDLYVSTGPRSPPVAPKVVKREPMYAPGPMGSPLTGVRLEAAFSRADIEGAAAPLLIVTDDKAEILWQARVDLSRYR
jgi:hypothetical protein